MTNAQKGIGCAANLVNSTQDRMYAEAGEEEPAGAGQSAKGTHELGHDLHSLDSIGPQRLLRDVQSNPILQDRWRTRPTAGTQQIRQIQYLILARRILNVGSDKLK
ncbi:hypothetical protein [Nocardia sp. NPDC056000]|uniref:hypothetical protein n=1 Tax=Nocardia sp. NPDC056000 TaxID=3345674 RepID=UPI0035D84E5C